MAPKAPKLHTPSGADIAALIENAKLPERIVPLCLRGDLHADLEALEQELTASQAAAPPSMGGETEEVEAVRARITEMKEQITAATVPFRMRALSDVERTALTVANPARDGVQDDAEVGYNMDVVDRVMIRQGCVWPELTDEQWTALEAKLTTWQRNQLRGAAYALTYQEVGAPF